MKKVKEFFKKYYATIISTLLAISSLFVAIEDFGGKAGTICAIGVGIVAIIVAIVKAIMSYLENGFTDDTIKLIVNAIGLIKDMLNGVYTETVVSANGESEEVKKITLTDEEIVELLKK